MVVGTHPSISNNKSKNTSISASNSFSTDNVTSNGSLDPNNISSTSILLVNSPHTSLNRPSSSQVSPLKVSSPSLNSKITASPSASTASGILRIEIIEARDLAAKDRGGTSDPFCILNLGQDVSLKTSVIHKTLNPVWNSVFDIPITPRMLDFDIKCVVWDKDLFGKDFLGQIVIPISSLIQLCGSLFHAEQANTSFWQPLAKRNPKEHISGTVHFKIGFLQPVSSDIISLLDPQHCDSAAISASIMALEDIPEDLYFNHMIPIKHHFNKNTLDSQESSNLTSLESTIDSNNDTISTIKSNTSNSKGDRLDKLVESLEKREKKVKNETLDDAGREDNDEYIDEEEEEYEEEEEEEEDEEEEGDSGSEIEDDYDQSNEAPDSRLDHKTFCGLLTIDIVGASNLPYENNVTRTSFDCDPFVVISFGKKSFRTRSIRHTLQPVWNERVFLHIKELEIEGNYNISFSVYDYDRFSKNDYIGKTDLKLLDVIKELKDNDRPIIPGITTPLTRIEKLLPLKLRTKLQKAAEETTLKIRYSFIRYELLRRNFWLTLLKAYDSGNVFKINKIELTALLDSIGSTFSEESINYMFMVVGKTPDQSLTYEEAVAALETAISGDLIQNAIVTKPRKMWNKIKRVTAVSHHISNNNHNGNSQSSGSVVNSSMISIPGSGFDVVYTSSPHLAYSLSETTEATENVDTENSVSGADSKTTTSNNKTEASNGIDEKLDGDDKSISTSTSEQTLGTVIPHGFSQREHVIMIRVCPICKKRIRRKGDLDVVSHVALCAHEDLGKIDNFVLGGFLTEAYASRKWYSKIVSYVTYGGYRIGKNNGNIIVQDSSTGQLIEERMPSYVRLGIRLIYQMAGGRDAVQSKKIKTLLRSMSVKQGKKFDDPNSRKSIKNFITFHNLNVNEIAEPLSNFKTFNEFFYRKLKPEARPISLPNDNRVIVSAADCRFSCFTSVSSAKTLWIKGREFTMENLIQDKELASKFDNAPLSIFRLAPQDYHRFHSPLSCKVVSIKRIEGEYYTVNPMAIRTTIDVYTDNVRCVLILENDDIGQFIMVCVGAMMVGSILITTKVGDILKKGDEIGYFAFGGSTVLTIFPPNSIEFDRQFESNSLQNLETLVKMGNKIGFIPNHHTNHNSITANNLLISNPDQTVNSTITSIPTKPSS